MRNLQVLAAGSLRDVWKMLMTAFHAESGLTANTLYGPAGLLRQRIEQGEICDLFVSADLQHPEKLRQQGMANHTGHFTNNRLCLTAKRDCVIEQDDWLSLLRREDLLLGTSTPLCDPAGDYTLLLFDHIEQHHPGCGDALRQRAIAMVGGPGSLPVPAGDLAAQWIITTGHAELFIGYASYAPRLARFSQLRVFNIPSAYNVQARYGWATLSAAARPLAAFLGSDTAQQILRQYGFLSLSQ
ncbi:substrate-binding domain-containing protein [Pantoea ananatis]|uniref:substrate-binding domain-containing protein n=1 Tax=Pantoea ananas TaxID=553 RepID=UPI0021F70F03|nr:substrate-binding domain-containing protein [Pantoea ananatis]MCW0313799.1 hypothetical protein [Pantoea ananatis]